MLLPLPDGWDEASVILAVFKESCRNVRNNRAESSTPMWSKLLGLLQSRVHRESNQLRTSAWLWHIFWETVKLLEMCSNEGWADLAGTATNWVIYKLIVERRKSIKGVGIKQKHVSVCSRGSHQRGSPSTHTVSIWNSLPRGVSMAVIAEPLESCQSWGCRRSFGLSRCQRGTAVFHQQFLSSSSSTEQAHKGHLEPGAPLARPFPQEQTQLLEADFVCLGKN